MYKHYTVDVLVSIIFLTCIVQYMYRLFRSYMYLVLDYRFSTGYSYFQFMYIYLLPATLCLGFFSWAFLFFL